MLYLVISLAMLIVAPFLYILATRFSTLWAYLQKIIITIVTSLVVLHLLPESIRTVGSEAVLLAFVGLALPSLLERFWRRRALRIHYISLGLGLLGLVVHGLLDGAALLGSPYQQLAGRDSGLQLAILLHRLPAGLLIWSLFYPQKGPWFPATLLLLLGLSTILGYLLGSQLLLQLSDARWLFDFQALISGSLLHIAFDRHGDLGRHPPS